MNFEEIQNRYRMWLLKVAHEYSTDKSEVQDLAQEGSIAMWRALNSYDGRVPLQTHLMNKARWRICEVSQRRNFTGTASRQGKKHSADTERNRGREVATDTTVSDFDAATEENFDAALVAYHHGEILRALNELPSNLRDKVVRRFWYHDYNPKNQSWWDAKPYGARHKLRERLEHLEELVNG